MNPVSRGIRNAFRNGVRTTSIVIILGLSIGLSLTMLVAQKAVDNKIKSVKSSIGNTITVAPAGFTPGSQQNNALSSDDLNKLKSLAHVSSVTQTLTDRESTTGTTSFMRGPESTSDSSATTSLVSPITLNTNGPRFMSGNSSTSDSSTDTATTFSLPISFLGTTDTTRISGSSIAITSGKALDGASDTDTVLISQAMATKNNLKVGDTFSAYNTTLTVAGIFKTDNESARGTVVLSLAALQRLSGQSGVVTSATVNVDSLDNLSSVTSAVKKSLGDTADVTSAEEQADATVKPLNSVKTVSTFSLIGAIAAGSVIILLTMIMVVRERKKEIGVVKAIGGSNIRIMSEFMVESLTLAVLGAIIGLVIGVVGGQPVTKTLVDNSTTSSTTTSMPMPGGGNFSQSNSATDSRRSTSGGFRSFRDNSAVQGLSNINAQIGWSILLEGFGAAVLISVIGSALAAGMIAKVRPSTVMRAD